MRRWAPPRSNAVIIAIATLILTGVAPASAALGALVSRRPIAVSVPAEAARLGPGESGTVPVRIVNPGAAPVTVRVRGRGVRFGDDGRVTMTNPDPMWRGRVAFPSSPITIAARSFRDIALNVRVPLRIDPDLYFIGFLVTPLSDVKANLTYVNQIGSYVTIDVPGPRSRVLTSDLQVPSFAFSNRVGGTLRVHNAGRAAAVFWGENDMSATPGSSRQVRIQGSLLPRGRSRTIVVEAKSSFPIALVTMRIHIFYPGRTDATTEEIILSKQVWVVQPEVFAALGGALALAFLWFLHSRRKRRRDRSRRRRAPAPRAVARVDRQLARVRVGVGTREGV